jgi:hypothetical protein
VDQLLPCWSLSTKVSLNKLFLNNNNLVLPNIKPNMACTHVNRSQVTRPKSYPGVIETSFELKKNLEEKRELSPHSKTSLFFFQNSFYLKSRTVNVNLKTSANKKKTPLQPASFCGLQDVSAACTKATGQERRCLFAVAGHTLHALPPEPYCSNLCSVLSPSRQ